MCVHVHVCVCNVCVHKVRSTEFWLLAKKVQNINQLK